MDIGRALETLHRILGTVNFQNLDDLSQFKGLNTTTEFLARFVFDRIRDAIRRGDLGPNAAGVSSLRVTLHESHVAWAAFEGPL